ncbi:hypothetical protein AcV7_009286 [Taiwanofungus camphoratus]|nr:hypothetical protein AcV7_009286 [Antrodia cinnamomea]
MMATTAYLLSGLFLSLVVLWRRRVSQNASQNSLRRPLPPGPPGIPFLKNVFDWTQHSPWFRFTEWKETYGDLVHINLLGQHIVIMNSFATSRDVMEQSTYADRPHFTMAGELMGFLPSIILSPYNSHWKFMRKLTHQAISKTAATRYFPYHEADARVFIRSLLDNPSSYREGLRYLLGKNIIQTTYGFEVQSPQDEYITVSEKTHHDLSRALIPGAFLVDVLPFLKYLPSWFPGAGFRKHAVISRTRAWKMSEEPYDYVKKAFVSKTAPPSFVATLLEQEDSINHDPANWETTVKWAAASLYGASTESSFASFSTFFLAMAMNPDVQRKAQEELDKVVGQERLPSFADRSSLPYVEAVVKETLRWHPPAPIGIAHRAMEDSYYHDYYIPKGTTVISNMWAICRDPGSYADPASFRPDRFMKADPELNPYEWSFGFGRRSCPGIHYATSILYIVMASVLHAFDIKAQDEKGNDVTLKAEFSDTFISYAEPFPCRITPRSSVIAELLRKDT